MTITHIGIGRGPQKVMAAHTWLANQATYAPMYPYLDTERFTYAFVAFRGYGESRGIHGRYSIEEMGQDLVDLANELQWDRFHLLGNSMGGQAAQWVAGSYPARVLSMALLCSVPARGFALDSQTQAFFSGAVKDLRVRAQISAAVTGERYGAGFARHMAEVSAATATEKAVEGYLRAWTSDNVEKQAKETMCPVHIWVGEHDPVLTADVMKSSVLPILPSAKLATISNSGHYPALEVPCYTAATIEAFFNASV
jgi:pimeloyl-ACP methyl ester carboxylesterase